VKTQGRLSLYQGSNGEPDEQFRVQTSKSRSAKLELNYPPSEERNHDRDEMDVRRLGNIPAHNKHLRWRKETEKDTGRAATSTEMTIRANIAITITIRRPSTNGTCCMNIICRSDFQRKITYRLDGKQLVRRGTLPAGLQKRIQPCPREFEHLLPAPDCANVLIGGPHRSDQQASIVVDIFHFEI
jgi:hypothetical protein